jgi:hypothetical protein
MTMADEKNTPAGSGKMQDAFAKDEAMAMVGEQPHAIDPVVAARAVRKIDRFLIPAMIFGCMCNEQRSQVYQLF